MKKFFKHIKQDLPYSFGFDLLVLGCPWLVWFVFHKDVAGYWHRAWPMHVGGFLAWLAVHSYVCYHDRHEL